MKRTVVLAVGVPTAALTAGVLAVAGPVAQARPVHSTGHAARHVAAATKGKETLHISDINNREGIVLNGVVNGYGRDTSPNDNYDVAHLDGGTLRLNHPDSTAHFTPHIDDKTCYASFVETGTGSLDHGTGAYKGVHGSFRYKGYGYGYLKRKSGSCDLQGNAKYSVAIINATGTLAK